MKERISTEQQKVDKEKFDSGWDRIFGTNKKKSGDCPNKSCFCTGEYEKCGSVESAENSKSSKSNK